MAARAMWKGVVRFGAVEVPVKLYSAARDRTVHFRLLHEKDRVPLRQHMVNPLTEEVVESEEVRRGYEAEEGVYVVLDSDELASVEPEPSRDIEVLRFVDPARLSHAWYDRPYYLGPDGEAAPYFALARALESEGKEGVARWVMRKKEYVGALRSAGDHLLLATLRYAGEVIPASARPAPPAGRLDKRELAMAEQLVGMLEDEFDASAYRDEYRERLMELIEAKAEGRAVRLKKPRRKESREPLETMLARSLERARKEGRCAA
jgi:DNA end-binding protein Ku